MYNFNSNSKPTCQICGKYGHSAAMCFYRSDDSYNGAPPDMNRNTNNDNNSGSFGNTAYMATSETLNDPRWYADSGASCHVTDDASLIDKGSEYNGKQMLTVGNGSKLKISRIGDSYLFTKGNKLLILKDMLHVPEITKNLLSVSQLTSVNNVAIEFDSFGCVVKDKAIGAALLRGKLKDGLY